MGAYPQGHPRGGVTRGTCVSVGVPCGCPCLLKRCDGAQPAPPAVTRRGREHPVDCDGARGRADTQWALGKAISTEAAPVTPNPGKPERQSPRTVPTTWPAAPFPASADRLPGWWCVSSASQPGGSGFFSGTSFFPLPVDPPGDEAPVIPLCRHSSCHIRSGPRPSCPCWQNKTDPSLPTCSGAAWREAARLARRLGCSLAFHDATALLQLNQAVRPPHTQGGP